jgi:hypothetical protein
MSLALFSPRNVALACACLAGLLAPTAWAQPPAQPPPEVAPAPSAEEAWPRPLFILKAGLGLPGLPGLAAEVFLRDSLTLQVEGGTGLVGAYGATSVRFRPCWGNARGATFCLGLGPELTVIPRGEAERTGIIVTLDAEPAFVYRFAPRFGWTVGLKLGLGPEWDFQNGQLVVFELANVFSLYTGVQF